MDPIQCLTCRFWKPEGFYRATIHMPGSCTNPDTLISIKARSKEGLLPTSYSFRCGNWEEPLDE